MNTLLLILGGYCLGVAFVDFLFLRRTKFIIILTVLGILDIIFGLI